MQDLQFTVSNAKSLLIDLRSTYRDLNQVLKASRITAETEYETFIQLDFLIYSIIEVFECEGDSQTLPISGAKNDFSLPHAKAVVAELRDQQRSIFTTLEASGGNWEPEYRLYLELDFIIKVLIEDFETYNTH